MTNFTDQGIRNVKATVERAQAVKKAAETAGGRVIGAYLDFHNALDYPHHFDIVFDVTDLPKGTWLSMLLPKVQPQAPVNRLRTNNIRLIPVQGKDKMWRALKGISKRGWRNHNRVEGNHAEPCTGRRLAEIPRVLIPAGGKVRAAVIVMPPPRAKPGSVYRFSIMQRQESVIVGGSTYEIRVPPAEVIVRK